MSDFKDNLDEEIEKRRHDDPPPVAKEKGTKVKNKTKSFSFKAFISGLVVCALFTAGLVGWAWLNADKTKQELTKKLPSKTAIIKTADNASSKTVLKIPAIHAEDVTQAPHSPQEEHPPIPVTSSKIGIGNPYKENQAPFTKKTNKPLLSFVIIDLGLSTKKTERIIKNFTKEVSLCFSPYAKDLNELTQKAKNDNHEIWLSLPLETKEYPLNDPGPSTLLVNASTEKNQARVHDLINSTQGYVGFISQQDHLFKTEDANVNPAIKEIFEQGYAIIDGNISIRSFIDTLADKYDYPYAQNHLWLDNNLTPLSINQNIRKITQQNGNVIVMLHPYPASLKAVQKFLNSKAVEAFELAPVSAQLKNNKS